MCVSAVLGDALRRVAVLGGREGMSRSLGSVYGGSVTRFLGGGLRGEESRVIATPGVHSSCNGMAVSRDGSTLLVSDTGGRSHAIHEYRISDIGYPTIQSFAKLMLGASMPLPAFRARC
jgi:sugar lactone lactonase YvrE